MQVYILPLSRVRLLPCVATWLLGCAILNAHTKAAEPVKIQELSYPWGFPLSGIVFSQDGSLLAAGESGDIAESYDGPHIIIWDVKSGKILHRIRLESLSKCTGQIGSLSFSSDGKNLLFCSSVDNALRVWDVQRGQVVRKIKGHEDDILLGAIYSPDGHFILSLNTKAIILYDALKGRQIHRFDLPNIELGSHTVDCLAFAPDAKSFASAGKEGVRLWDIGTGRMVRHITVPPGRAEINYLSSVVIPEDGKTIVGFCDANYYEFFVWDVQTGKLVRRFGDDPHPERGCFSQNGRLALANKFTSNRDPKDGVLLIYETTTAKQLYRIRSGSALDRCIALSPNGRRVLVVDEMPAKGSPRIIIWELPQ